MKSIVHMAERFRDTHQLELLAVEKCTVDLGRVDDLREIPSSVAVS